MAQLRRDVCLMLFVYLKDSGAQPCKITKNLVHNPFYSNALYNNVFARIWIFLSTSSDKQVSQPFEPFERSVYGSEKLCQSMSRKFQGSKKKSY